MRYPIGTLVKVMDQDHPQSGRIAKVVLPPRFVKKTVAVEKPLTDHEVDGRRGRVHRIVHSRAQVTYTTLLRLKLRTADIRFECDADLVEKYTGRLK